MRLITTRILPLVILAILGPQAVYSYSPDTDRVRTETDHFGNVKSMAYDARGNVTIATMGAGTSDAARQREDGGSRKSDMGWSGGR
ncbi:MAG: RHS repeat protein [Opitutae bacterium]|nr:RHS repeat protein [Opitutae bacterium]